MSGNRTIKFRAWDKKENEWKRFVEFGVIADENNGFVVDAPEYIEITEFTGLKDKNGKEIYEGDILKAEFSNGQDMLGVVKYDDCWFSIKVLKNEGFWEEHHSPLSKHQQEVMEVIGNVFEDKHLLEDE